MKNYYRMIRRRLLTMGVLPKHSRGLAFDFDQQVKLQGEYNALNYFKEVGDTLIGFHSLSGYKAPHVKTTHGYPTRWLMLKDYSLDIQLTVAKMARAIYYEHPTDKQLQKIHSSAVRHFAGDEIDVDNASRLVSLGRHFYSLTNTSYKPVYRSVFSSARTFVTRSVPEAPEVGLKINLILSCFHGWKDLIVSCPNWDQVFYPLHPSWVGRNFTKFPVDPSAGQVSSVMEQGGKLRMFAAPNVLLQNLLEPLQLWLDRFREQIPNDCFKDQSEGMRWVVDKMETGHEVQSIDLSSATCRFPFILQTRLLTELGAPPTALKLYEEVARATWKVTSEKLIPTFGDTLTWSVGQPLGTNPSMSSFALTHSCLLAGLCVELDINPLDSFRILGDDVVTCNPDLESRYRHVMSGLDVSISEHKSYRSTRYAEFAGYSITPHCQVRPGQWRECSVLNIQNLIERYGISAVFELPESEHFFERQLAFSRKNYDPVDIHEWMYRTYLNSMTLLGPLEFQFRNKQVSWFDGCCRYLQGELQGMNPYFDSESESVDLFAMLGEDEITKKVYDLMAPSMGLIGDYTWHVTQVILLCESFAKDAYDYHGLVTYIQRLKALYEAVLWSVPKTDKQDKLASRKKFVKTLAPYV